MRRSTKPGRRHVLAIICVTISALCLLMLVASVGRTYFVMSQFADSLGLKAGSLSLSWARELKRAEVIAAGYPPDRQWRRLASARVPPMEWWPPIGYYSNVGYASIVLSLWPVVLTFGLLGARLLRRTPFAPPLCPRCGYDNASNYSAPCPECGLLTSPSATSSHS